MVSVMGKRVGFKIMETTLNRAWAMTAPIKIIDMPQGFFLVMFNAETDYKRALFEGPWRVADHYILVQRWRPCFMATARVVRKVAVWIRVPGRPIELYNDQFLWRLGSNQGVMLKIDRVTSLHCRGQFARICVELDLTKPLESKVVARGQILQLEYEGLHTICFKCGLYGHLASECALSDVLEKNKNDDILMNSMAEKVDEQPQNEEVATKDHPGIDDRADVSPNPKAKQQQVYSKATKSGIEQTKKDEENDYGPWMLVRRPIRKHKQKGMVVKFPPNNKSGGIT